MLISIIIPTYNRVSFLIETVNSILDQTYKNFEIIIISDGSTDNTNKEISKITDSRLKFIQLEKNYGYPAKARNEGIKISKGKFIAFCDDDDIWERNKLEKQIKFINLGFDFIFTGYNYLDKSNNIFYDFYLKFMVRIIINIFPNTMSFFYLSITNPIVNSSVLVKKSLISKILFNEAISFRASEDYQLWIQIYDSSRPYYIKDPLVIYRVHEHNISNNFIKNLERCKLVFENFKPSNHTQKIFKKLGIFFYSIRIFIKK